ncbi:MAG: DUF3052 domain-containing protein [Gemmatimonadota bacterium]
MAGEVHFPPNAVGSPWFEDDSMASGYSSTPLVRKLGIREGRELIAIHAPRPYEEMVSPLPEGVKLRQRLHPGAEFIHLFSRTRADLERRFPRLASALADQGILWISWPKKSSPLAQDLSENLVREIGLATGLVDVKVVAIDEDWSGLKFVRRLVNRGG